MKYFVFAKSWRGFKHWLHSNYQMKRSISSYLQTQSLEFKESKREEYDEAKYSFELYQRFRSKLNKDEREYIDNIIHHHDNSCFTKVDYKHIYELWIEIVMNREFNTIVEIDNKTIGAAIKNGREFRCFTRVEVAKLIGAAPETLKAYENGDRTLPFTIFYKLNQILKIDIKL